MLRRWPISRDGTLENTLSTEMVALRVTTTVTRVTSVVRRFGNGFSTAASGQRRKAEGALSR